MPCTIQKVAEDQYKVAGFLQSMPKVACVVTFERGIARVTQRVNTTETCWDQHAIQAVQTAIFFNAVG